MQQSLLPPPDSPPLKVSMARPRMREMVHEYYFHYYYHYYYHYCCCYRYLDQHA